MQALVSTAQGIFSSELPQPRPAAEEVLVRVRAASLNRADLAVAAARTGRPLGMEWAGDVVECGAGANLRIGDRVICTGVGGFAEYSTVDSRRTIPLPPSFGYDEGSVLGGALQTMHDALVTNGGLCPGQTVLIHGASSAVGLLGLQIAKALGASRVLGSSTNAVKRERLHGHGADVVIDPTQPRWSSQVLDATEGCGADLVVDLISGPGFEETMKATAIRGRIVNVGRLGGDHAEFNFDLHALRRLDYVGVTFRTRSVQEVRVLNEAMLQDLGALISAGRFRLPIHSRFALRDGAEALELMASNRHFGKIVLET